MSVAKDEDSPGKRRIDRRRDAAVSMRIEDGSTIRDTLSTGANLYLITESAVIRVQLADDIDPGRTNEGIPNLTQRVLPAGDEDEIVGRILLTAKYLFDERNAKVKPFVAELLETCLVLTKQLLELDGMSREFADEIRGKERALESKRVDASAFSLPSIPGIDRKVLNLISAAEKAKDSVLLLFRAQFLPGVSGKPKLSDLKKAVEEFMQGEPDRIVAWNEMENYFALIRNIRNASEHRREGHDVILTDFRMWPDGRVYPPLVEVRHDETPIGRVTVIEFLEFIRTSMIDYAEVALTFIKSAALLRDNPFNESVAEAAEPMRRHRFVRYYRAIRLNTAWHILG